MKLPKQTIPMNADRDLIADFSFDAAVNPSACNPFNCKGRCDCAYEVCKATGLPGCDIARAACHAYCDN